MRCATCLTVVFAVAVSGSGFGQPPDTAKRSVPGPERKVLEKFVGTFDVAGTIYAKDPNASPTKITGTTESKFLGTSEWVVCKGSMKSDKFTAEEVGIICYDVKRGKFAMTGANSVFPTTLSICEGTYDDAKKTVSWAEHEMTDPDTGEAGLVKGEDVFREDGSIAATMSIKRKGSNEFVKWAEFVMTPKK